MAWVREILGGVEIELKVVPKASRDRVVGILGDALKVQVSAAPEKGKANAALCALLAKVLGCAKNEISVIRGEAQPRKTIHVRGVSLEMAKRLLQVKG